MKKGMAVVLVLLFCMSSISIVVATPEYRWEEGDYHAVAGYSQTPDINSYGVRESRDIVYHNGTWYFYARYKKNGETYYGYMLVNTTDYENPADPFYVTPDNAMGDNGWPNWAVHWYNKYTDELIFLWNKAYTSAFRTGGAYKTTYNFSNDTWVFNKLWKAPENYDGRDYAPMFVYSPMEHVYDGQKRLIMPVALVNKTSGDVGFGNVTIYYSDDLGQTWSCKHNETNEYIFVPGQPQDDVEENSIIELPNGSLCMLIRIQNYDWANSYYMWRSFSWNHGMNWTSMERVDSIPLAITKNLWRNATIYGRNIYILYANHRPEGWDTIKNWCWGRRRSNVSMRVSFDGLTWSDPHIIHPNEFGQGYDGTGNYTAYGSFITLNNTFYCCHYFGDGSTQQEGCPAPTDQIMWTVNLIPKVLWTNPSIENGTVDVPINSDFTIDINDYDGDGITWSLECSNGDSSSGSSEANGTKTLDLSGLSPNHEYTIWANATGAWLNQTITFDTQEGIQFLSINDNGNGTTIYDATPVINWTAELTASMYWLQIDNNADFSSPVANYSDINEYNYPVHCSINDTVVSFTLPSALPSYDTYYMRVRAYTR